MAFREGALQLPVINISDTQLQCNPQMSQVYVQNNEANDHDKVLGGADFPFTG